MQQQYAATAGAWPASRSPRIAHNEIDRNPLLDLVKIRERVSRGETIVDSTRTDKQITVLLDGLACMSTLHKDGSRQIYTFHHPGDLLVSQGMRYPNSIDHIQVQALSKSLVGLIERNDLEQAIQRRPALGQVLWRAAMVEASILRQRLITARWPALPRVAHLLCEQLTRLGVGSVVVPLNQIEVSDAVGLSVVHTNRVFKDLRQLGVLSQSRRIEVLDEKRLRELASFDGRYLDVSDILSRWELRIE
jgi:CRP-like cAMP-binding protein